MFEVKPSVSRTSDATKLQQSGEQECDTSTMSVSEMDESSKNGAKRFKQEKNIQAFEIDDQREREGTNIYDTDDDDLESLLGDGINGAVSTCGRRVGVQLKCKRTSTDATSELCCVSLRPHEKIGNMTIFLPSIYHRTGWGIMGPHWFGPPCVIGILVIASVYFVRESFYRIGPLSAATCVGFALQSVYYLVLTSYGDPGVVPQSQQQQQDTSGDDLLESRLPRGSRWCDVCQTYQPPDGAHCPDCNVCVAGFDHHCVWMGTCIGKYNIKTFLRFNLTWLVYLLYSILWVTILGPMIFHGSHHRISADPTKDQNTLGDQGTNIDPSAGVGENNSTGSEIANFTIFF